MSYYIILYYIILYYVCIILYMYHIIYNYIYIMFVYHTHILYIHFSRNILSFLKDPQPLLVDFQCVLEATFGHARAVADCAHHGWSKWSRRVDGTAVHGQQNHVGQEHGETDGNAGVLSTGRGSRHSRLPNHKAKYEGAQDLGHQDISDIEAICDDVGSQSHSTHVFGTGKHDTKQASSGHTAKQLCKQVGQTLIPSQFPTQYQRQCHGTIDLTTWVMTYCIGQHQDAHAKGQRHLQAIGGVRSSVGASSTTTNDHKESHGDELRNCCLLFGVET